jgi:hypothetical protein
MTKRLFSSFVLITFFAFALLPALGDGIVQASVTDLVEELQEVYGYLDDDEKAAISAARDNLQTLAGNPDDAAWDIILNPLMTDEVKTLLGGEAAAKTALIDFAAGMGDIYYSTDATDLETTLDEFKNENKDTFKTLFGDDITIDDCYGLLLETKDQMRAAVTSNPSYIQKLAHGNNNELIDTIPLVVKDAVIKAVNQNYPEFKNKLSAIGWSITLLIEQQNDIADEIDPSKEGRKALAMAAVRSEAQYTGRTAFIIGEQPQYNVTILGGDASNMVDWASSDESIIPIVTSDKGNMVPGQAARAGTVTLTAYRNYQVGGDWAGDPAKDWILKIDVTVSPGQLSTNANLATLTTTAGTLVPAFDPNVTSYKVVLPSDYGAAVPTIGGTTADANAAMVITQAGDLTGTATIVVTAQDGTTNKTYSITFDVKKVETVSTEGDVPINIDSTSSNIELDFDPGVDVEKVNLNVTIPKDVPVATVTVPVATVGETKEATLPAMNVTTTQDLGATPDVEIKVEIPAGTKVTAPAGWDGTITMPTVKAQPSAPVSGAQSVDAVIEVGLGDVQLNFDKAVRLIIPGRAGKSAAFVRGGIVTPITRTLSADNQATADAEIPGNGDAKIDSGNDLAIWTKHFTEFIAYTPKSSGGGGGGAPYTGTTVPVSGGKVSRDGATVNIPNGALTESIRVKVAKFTNISSLTFAPDTVLVSDVIEITKDKSGDFLKPVSITLNYDKTKVDLEKYDLALFWYDTAKKEWQKLDDITIDAAKGTISGTVMHFTKFAVIAAEKATVPVVPEVELSDIKGHWAEANITKLVTAQAITGYQDGTFKPDNSITRAEFATVLVKAYQLPITSGQVFNDTANHWAKDYISTAAANGIITGYSSTQFGPDDLITREQMAVMVIRAEGMEAPFNTTTFTDDANIADWAKESVAAASGYGIITGYEDNTFKPKANLTRAEAVTVIARALEK